MCIFNIFSLIVLIFFDIQYYIRIISVVLFGRLFEKKQKVTDPTVIYGKQKLHYYLFNELSLEGMFPF